MTTYGKELMSILNKDKTIMEIYGIPIQIKGIPDELRPGCLDPRELNLLKAQTVSASPDVNAPENEKSIEDIRDSMGFPNRNLNTAEIYTRFEELNFGGSTVKLWIYYPRRPAGKSNRPGFIYIHGGGWVGGTPFAVENPCRLLTERADCVVINVDYSLAPEKPYPQGFNDCFHTLEYVYANAEKFGIDKDRIGMGGDSAGGNLTAACALKDRDLAAKMLKYQVLIYPVVTMIDKGIPGYEWKLEDFAIHEEQRGIIEPCLSLGRPKGNDEFDTVISMYLHPDGNPRDPFVSPLLASSYTGLCKTFIAVAEFDGLRIQGEIFAKKLMEAGVDTRIIRYKGVTHAFLDKLGVLPQAEDLIQEIANDLAVI